MLNLQFIPFPTFITERLTLRELGLPDADAILVQRSHPEINKFIHRELAKSREDAIAFIERVSLQQQNNESVTWAITLGESSNLIGQLCLWNINAAEETAELGYSLHPDYFKKGIMSESVRRVLEYGFSEMGLKRIDAFTNKDNIASLKLLERLNFSRNLILEENLEDKSELDYNQIFSVFI